MKRDYYTTAIQKTENRMLRTDPKSQGYTLLNNLVSQLKLKQKQSVAGKQGPESGGTADG